MSMKVYLFLFLSALGFMDAAFLTIQHYSRDPLSCPLFGGCDAVTNSVYSEIFGIPVALLGAIYYAIIFLGTLMYYLTDNKKIFYYIAHFTAAGFIASIYLFSLMLFVIKAFCFYCIISCITSTILFALGFHTIVNLHSWTRKRNLQKESAKS